MEALEGKICEQGSLEAETAKIIPHLSKVLGFKIAKSCEKLRICCSLGTNYLSHRHLFKLSQFKSYKPEYWTGRNIQHCGRSLERGSSSANRSNFRIPQVAGRWTSAWFMLESTLLLCRTVYQALGVSLLQLLYSLHLHLIPIIPCKCRCKATGKPG